MSEEQSQQMLQRIRELADKHLSDITDLRAELDTKEKALRECYIKEREMTKKQTIYCIIN